MRSALGRELMSAAEPRKYGPYDVRVGTRARFFHPRTMGVMHEGVVRGIRRRDDGELRVRVHFEVDNRSWWTTPEHFDPHRVSS